MKRNDHFVTRICTFILCVTMLMTSAGISALAAEPTEEENTPEATRSEEETELSGDEQEKLPEEGSLESEENVPAFLDEAEDEAETEDPADEEYEDYGIMTLVYDQTRADATYDYLVNTLGFSTAAACGIMANIDRESGFIPTISSSTGKYYGLCQWSPSRTSDLKSYAGDRYDTMEGQLDFMLYEMKKSYSSVYNTLTSVSNSASGAATAAWNFCYYYEGPGNTSTPDSRASLASGTYWPLYSGQAVAGSLMSNSYTGFQQNSSGEWVYYKNGAVATGTDIVQGTVDGTDAWWYIKNGKISNTTTVAQNSYGWWYVENGKVDFSYNGFAQNSNGWWYIEAGKVIFSKNSVVQDKLKKIDGQDSWWYVVGGQVQTDFTGLADYSNSQGWWYISNGKVTFNVDTVAKNQYGWWYVKGSKVDFSYNGFAENSYGLWYLEGGKVIFSTNSVIHDTEKQIDNTSGWWYVVGGQVQKNFTGLANYSNANGWWYIKNGKVDFSVNTVAQNNYGWWYVTGGKVQFGYTGVSNYSNAYGWWYIKGGKVDFSANTVAQNKYGWWYVTGGKVQFGFSGLANYSNPYGWWYIKNGKVDFSANTVAQNNYGSWYVKDGKVDFGYNGTFQTKDGLWTIKDGKAELEE